MAIIYHCDICDRITSFSVISTHILPDEGPPEEYSFAICETCRKPSVFYREDMGDGFEGDSYYRSYPPHERHLPFLMPPLVRESYEEAVRCENAKLFIAASVMIGRTLEALCRDYEPKKTIHGALESMKTKGIISAELWDWANELRVLRNYGAHPMGEVISAQDAREGLDFLQTILDIFYNLRPKFQQMRERRNRGQASSSLET